MGWNYLLYFVFSQKPHESQPVVLRTNHLTTLTDDVIMKIPKDSTRNLKISWLFR